MVTGIPVLGVGLSVGGRILTTTVISVGVFEAGYTSNGNVDGRHVLGCTDGRLDVGSEVEGLHVGYTGAVGRFVLEVGWIVGRLVLEVGFNVGR